MTKIEQYFQWWFQKKYNRKPNLDVEHDNYLFIAFQAGFKAAEPITIDESTDHSGRMLR